MDYYTREASLIIDPFQSERNFHPYLYITRSPIQLLHQKTQWGGGTSFYAEAGLDACSLVLLSITNILRDVSNIRECYELRSNTCSRLLCSEISVDVYAVCVFSGRVIKFQHNHTS